VKKMNIQEKAKGQPRPVKDAETGSKLQKFCPFCHLRKRLQRELRKLTKERPTNDRKT